MLVGMAVQCVVSTASAPTLLPPSVLMCGGTPAMEVLYAQNAGTEVVGSLQNVLSLLLSLCPQNGDGNTYPCASYDARRLALWTQMGTLLCGFPADAWNGAANLAEAPVDSALEFLLAQCPVAYAGNLSLAAQQVVQQFTSLTAQLRPDVSAVIAANAAEVGLNVSTATPAQLAPLYASLFPGLAPVPGAGREPAVVAAAPPPPGVAAEYVPYVPAAAPDPGNVFPELSNPESTVQYPQALAAAALTSGPGKAMYQKWLAHPHPAARFNPAYCAAAAWDDPVCFPPVVPLIGYTHDQYGRRLLSDRGQPL
jgi:hypothetical protein